MMKSLMYRFLFHLALFLYLLPCIYVQLGRFSASSILSKNLDFGNQRDTLDSEDPNLIEKVRRREFFSLREDKLARKIMSRVRRREEDDLLMDLMEHDGLEKMFSSPSVLKKTIKANP